MLHASVKSADRLVVRQAGAPLIGVSGHCLATLDLGTEVTKIGDYATYTVVYWKGHQGYMETALLADQAELMETTAEQEQSGDQTAASPEETRRFGLILPWRRKKALNRTAAPQSDKKYVA